MADLGEATRLLVRDLERQPPSDLIDQIIANAKRGLYHDFRSEAATPKMLLDEHLRKADLEELCKNCQLGRYDDKPDGAFRHP